MLRDARRGLALESRETNGIAHFAEHMFFKGTERRPTARDIAGEIDSIGGEFNAFTGKEYTGYYVKCAAEHRDTALDVLVDMLRNSKFEPEEIEREKGVIVEEMNMYYDTPRDYLEGVYDDLLYGDTPLGWDIIGKKETVRSAKRETFLEYLDHWYRAPRMVAGVAGAVGDDIVPRLEELLGDVPNGAKGTPPPVEWNQDRAQVKVHTKQSDQAHIRVGVHATRSTTRTGTRSAACDRPGRRHVVSALHGGARAARARLLRVRLQHGLHGHRHALRAGRCRHQADRRGREDDRGRVWPDRRRARGGRRAREGAELRQGPARALAQGCRRERSCSGSGARCSRARCASRTDVLAGYDAVTIEDIQRVAQDIISENRLNLAVIGPFDDPGRFEKQLELA